MASKLSVVSNVGVLFVLLFSPTSGVDTVVRRHSSDEAQVVHVSSAKPAAVSSMTMETNPRRVIQRVLPSATTLAKRHDDDSEAILTISLWRACAVATTLTIGLVISLYWHKGPYVVTAVIIYLLALATIKGAVKLVEDGCSFTYPLFLTGTHFVCCAFVGFAMLVWKSAITGENMAKPSLEGFATRLGPVSLAHASSVSMNNIALVYSTTAFVEIVGAATPIVTVLVTLAMKQPFDTKLLGPCFLVFVGCALTSDGEPRFSMLGLLLAFGSNVPRAVKTVLQQLMLQKDTNAVVYSPLEVLAWTSIPSSVIMLTWSLVQEGTQPYHKFYEHGLFSKLTVTLLLSCLNACILNFVILFVIKDLGAVGTQIVSQTKSILVVLGGMCFLKEQVSRIEVLGFILVLIGVYMYNDIESRLKAQNNAEGKAVEENTALVKNVK